MDDTVHVTPHDISSQEQTDDTNENNSSASLVDCDDAATVIEVIGDADENNSRNFPVDCGGTATVTEVVVHILLSVDKTDKDSDDKNLEVLDGVNDSAEHADFYEFTDVHTKLVAQIMGLGLFYQKIYLAGPGMNLQDFQKRFSRDGQRSGHDSEKMHILIP